MLAHTPAAGLAHRIGALVQWVLLGTTLWVPQVPDITALTHYEPKQPLRVYRRWCVIGGFGSERRVYQRFDQIPSA